MNQKEVYWSLLTVTIKTINLSEKKKDSGKWSCLVSENPRAGLSLWACMSDKLQLRLRYHSGHILVLAQPSLHLPLLPPSCFWGSLKQASLEEIWGMGHYDCCASNGCAWEMAHFDEGAVNAAAVVKGSGWYGLWILPVAVAQVWELPPGKLREVCEKLQAHHSSCTFSRGLGPVNHGIAAWSLLHSATETNQMLCVQDISWQKC